VVVRGQPKGGPPPERQINFSSVSAPRPARRATNNAAETADEPYAWESREFLRKKVLGKEVVFTIDPKSKTLPREYGNIFLGKDIETGENITELMVSEGWLSVRAESQRGADNPLVALEEQAKAAKKGKWAGDDKSHIRNVKWNMDNTRQILNKYGGKKLQGIVEHVRDGSTVRLFLLPDFQYVTLMLSGIRCPGVHLDGSRALPGTAEALGEQAKYFVESRMLQRDIQVVLETNNNNSVVGSLLHPSGNIAEALLREGFAKCVDWSMTTVTGGPEKLRAAEKIAKSKRMRIWADYQAPTNQVSDKERDFTGKVVEIVNADAVMVQTSDGKLKKCFLASIRPPRLDDNEKKASGKVFRPLYDIPHMFEAREFLRKKLIDQKVHVTVDYIQPAQNNYPEKTCCTIKLNDMNVAEAVVGRGLATVVRYRQDDDQRALHYDDLLAAEAKALKGGLGLHSKRKEVPLRFRDLSEPGEGKKNFGSLKRLGKIDAVPEFVASGSRLRVFIPKETCIITFLLAGIQCPRAPRAQPGGGTQVPGDAFGAEAYAFTKQRVLQRSVQIEVDSMDKGGNMIGWLYYDNGARNLSLELVKQGLSKMHVTAEASEHYYKLEQAEKEACGAKRNMWHNYVPQEVVEKVEEMSVERKVAPRRMLITEVAADGRLYGQNVSDGPAIEALSDALQRAFHASPPLPGAYRPKRGDVCAAQFVDGAWYRARVEKVSGGRVHLYYTDFGNRQVSTPTLCAQLPAGLEKGPFFAKEMLLALVKYHQEDDALENACAALRTHTDGEVVVNSEWRAASTDHVTLAKADKTDVAKLLLQTGMVLLDPRRDTRFEAMVKDYTAAQDAARKGHLGIWRYGDITDDDAPEFGVSR